MFHFQVLYADGTKYTVSDINKVIVDTAINCSVIESDEILSAKFSVPFESMRLVGPSTNVTVSGHNAIVVEVSKDAK